MTEEVVYADLNILEDSSPTGQPPPLKRHALQGSAHWNKYVLWIALAGNVILATTVIVLGVQVFQASPPQTDADAASPAPHGSSVAQRHCPGGNHSGNLEELVSRLQQSLCPSAQGPSAGGSSCKLCPVDWLLHRGKCYWFSKELRTWNKSCGDCSAKRSQMLVIQDQGEMEFIQNFTQGKPPVWLGLRFISAEKNWTWVDSSVLDQTLFPVSGPADTNSCGVLKGSQMKSEICSAEFKWICQKEAMLL
ncbi:killer cell lectin-like receptor subfamily F member 1 [Carettochelys insculpta]|uniref:killer cell lectin-like receptor subfamily F member 1 n=1 Tax=Carettochelys insculpta TaxID=44489 RepID=UPI003EBEBABC